MKTLIAFIQKEFRHILRDKWTLLIIVGMPIAQLLLFGFAINTEVRDASVAVFDPVCDELTSRIVERIDASDYFNVTERITDIDRINDIFREGYTSLVIVFSDNFSNDILNGEAGIQLIADGTDPNQASMITAYAGNILASCREEIAGGSGTAAGITPAIRMLYNPQGKSSYNFVPGVMGLILMLICAMMTAVAIVREKESGSMEVLLTSPVSPFMIITAKAIPYLVLSVFDLILILVCAVFVMGVPIAGSVFSLAFVSVLFLICTLCLGLLISTLVETQMAAMIASGVRTDDADHAPVRTYIPYRKHAARPPVDLDGRPGTLVHPVHQDDNDPRHAAWPHPRGNRCPDPHYHHTHRFDYQELQDKADLRSCCRTS